MRWGLPGGGFWICFPCGFWWRYYRCCFPGWFPIIGVLGMIFIAWCWSYWCMVCLWRLPAGRWFIVRRLGSLFAPRWRRRGIRCNSFPFRNYCGYPWILGPCCRPFLRWLLCGKVASFGRIIRRFFIEMLFAYCISRHKIDSFVISKLKFDNFGINH